MKGFYVPVRNKIDSIFVNNYNLKHDSLSSKIIAALFTGTLGAIISNPVDVIKIRQMSIPGYNTSIIYGLYNIHKTEGFQGLIKGVVPSTLRGASIAVGELATYDYTKVFLKRAFYRGQESSYLHISASLVTGLVAATVAAPFDLIKTRYLHYIHVFI